LVSAIGLAIVVALHADARVQSQQPSPNKSVAPTESTPLETDYAPPTRAEADRILGTGFVMPDVPDDWTNGRPMMGGSSQHG